MTVRAKTEWRPDWAVHPGEIVRETLGEMGLTGVAAANRLGVAQSYLSDVLRGRRGVSPRMAIRLETLGGSPAEFWVSLQAQYDLAVERKRPLGKQPDDLTRAGT